MKELITRIVQTPRLLPIGVAVLAIVIFLLLVIIRPTPDVSPQQAHAIPVALVEAKSSAYSPNLVLYGRIEAHQEATLKAGIVADVVSVPVKEGERVTPGQVLVTLDKRDAELKIKQRHAEARQLSAQLATETNRHARDKKLLAHGQTLLQLAEKNLERLETLRKQNNSFCLPGDT